MPVALAVPDNYGLVLGAAVSAVFVNVLHMMKVGEYRKKYGIKPPAATAGPEHLKKNPNAGQFDCAFRAHANFNENLPSFLTAMAITGLRFPVVSAAAGGVWTLGRIAYLYGYVSKSGPKARQPGFLVAALAQLAMACGAAYTAYTFVF